jgi:cytochrome c-type biogenesis protein CcmH
MTRINAMLAALSVLLLVPFAGGQEQVAALETQAKQIETLLIAPCCWRQPISDHQSEIAEQMKVEIRQLLEKGQDRQQILDHYVDQYGARILSIPPQQGFNRTAYLMPVFFTILGLVVVGVILRKWQRQAPQPVASAGASDAPISDELAQRIQKELDEME